MAKIKFSKGELKRQRDALKQYGRYLPTLQLKKQQLQVEILRQLAILKEKQDKGSALIGAALTWAGLLSEEKSFNGRWAEPKRVLSYSKNIAGVDLAVFEKLEFDSAEYDLFTMPLWVDSAIDELRAIVSSRKEIEFIEKGIGGLRHELRVTTQRVNLFEKVKIPEAEEAIRLIKIYIGDQMANAVGRSKAAKRKIEKSFAQEVFA